MLTFTCLVRFETFAEENIILAYTPSDALLIVDATYLEAHLRGTEQVLSIELIDSEDNLVASYRGAFWNEHN